MATIANWNGHTFVVSPTLIRSFTEMRIKGACETTDKNSDKQKYVERKYGEKAELSLKIGLNALTGVTDVFGEAMQYVQEATDGACAYFYLGDSKVLPAKLMLVKAEVSEVALMPGRGDKWISCDVTLNFKQGTKNDGSTGSGGSGPANNKNATPTRTVEAGALAAAGYAIATGKFASKDKLDNLTYRWEQAKSSVKADVAEKVAQLKNNTNKKTNPTTSRSCDITLNKITLIPKSVSTVPTISKAVR